MTTCIHDNLVKLGLLLILILVLIFQSTITSAQAFRAADRPYKGLVAGFGTRATTVSSNIEKIHQSRLQMAGGQIGLIYGNHFLRAKVHLLGYYSSTGNTTGTTDLYTSSAALNFYPLSLISGNAFLITPYITGSLDYDRYKFFGFYINQEPGTINYSQGEAPYLGKITQVNATLGVGVEVQLKDHLDFIHIFSEIRYGKNLSAQAGAAFSATSIADQTQVAVGVSFGLHR